MLPSSGFFAHLNCPFFKRGLCERPHCVYRHVRAVPEMYGTSDNSSTDTTVTEEATDEYLQELERINEEIETVKQQVEQGQKRLSHYQIKQATGLTNSSFSKSEMAGENVSQDSYSSYSSLSKQRPKARKYVLDASKPRTDLEYDPLSNFSSDLRSYSSSNKEHKIKNGQGSKREHCKFLQKKTDVNKLPLSQTLSPVYIDSNEDDDDVLIIDIPTSPDKTKRKTARAINPVVVNEPHVSATLVSANVSGHLEGVGAVAKPLEFSGPPITIDDSTWDDPLLEEENIFVKMAQRLADDNERVNQAQPCHDLQNDLLFHKTSTADIKTQKTKQLVQKMNDIFSSKGRASQLQSNVQTLPNTMPGQIQKETIHCHTVQQEQIQMVFVGSLCEPQDILSAANLMRTTQMPSASSEQQSEQEPFASSEQQSEQEPFASSEQQREQEQEENNFIVIDSSSESELSYSGMELSESDPEEECYRIFMEANNEAKRNEPPPVLVGNTEVEKVGVELKLHTLAGKKRVAHNAKLAEQQTENRPQPRVLVPLRGPVSSRLASQPPVPSMSRKIEQRASTLTSSTKVGQASISKRQFETQRAPTAPSPVTTNQGEYVNYIPLGATVIDVGNNLHLVLPEGTFPVSGSSHQVTSVLTPTSQVNANPITIKKSNQSGVAPSQQKRTMQPVIPPLARKLVATASATRCTPIQAPAAVKPMATKRKIKHCDAAEVPHDIRQSYVNKFTEEFLKTTSNVNKAFEKALAEERTVYNRSTNKLKYLSVAVNALKRLRNQSSGAVKDKHEVSQKTKGSVPLNLSQVKGKDMVFYECLKGYVLTEEKLIENNFPLQHPEKLGSAVLSADDKKSTSDSLRKLCCRCGATYSVSRTGKHTRKEECTYHYGKGVKNKVPGGVETRYSCCEGVMGSPGCQVFKLHVCNSLSLDGFVSTAPKCLYEKSCPGVYSLDCEMCYTIAGLELSRVTVVNSSLQIVYDTFVKPRNEVIDYNTRFSGIGKDDMKEHCHTLSEVQETLLSFIHADTILIGHGLETDLCVLKLLHGMVVDTSVVFPHRLGLPHKLSLNSLTAEYLRKIIQESVCGHDTAEDAVACMELMLWKVKEDGKLKKNII